MPKQFSTLFLAALAFAFVGCGSKDSDKDGNLDVPAVRPPVQAALPSALLQGGTSFSSALVQGVTGPDYTKTCQTDATTDSCMLYSGADRIQCIVKQRLFCGGPTEVLNLLDGLDSRTKEIDERSSGDEACLSATPVDRTADLTFPGAATFPHFLQCHDANIGLGFGKKDGTWYLRQALGAGGYLFSADAEGEVNGYLWLPSMDSSFNMSTGILQIKASKTAGIVEFTGGGVGFGFCAIHYRSDASHIWVQINPDGVGTSCDSNSSSATDADDYSEICLDSATLSQADEAACASLKSGSTLSLMGRGSTTGGGKTFEAAAPPAEGDIARVDLNDLKTLFNDAADMASIAAFGK